MWFRMCPTSRSFSIRRFSTSTARRRIKDEGDWFYASEWWGPDIASTADEHTVLRSNSTQGNGVVSVLAYPSSRPSEIHWPETETWLSQRYSDVVCSGEGNAEAGEKFKIIGYQWRILRFNDQTRQSTAKVMAAYQQSHPYSIFLMQQPHCLAIPYLKSMVSVGLTTIASCNYDLAGAVYGKKTMRILCIGHGGGSLPLFLASKIQGAMVDIVEIDPLVISASVKAMGFPAFSVMTTSDQRALSEPSTIDEVMWRGIHERLQLYESDAEQFVFNSGNLYDMIFIDAYDGDDIFPRKLWDPDSTFLNSLNDRLHPEHGTVVVNLHADQEAFNPTPSFFEQLLPMSKHVHKVCRAYKEILIGKGNYSGGKPGSGSVFTVAVPWVCNASMVVCRGLGSNGHCSRDFIANSVISKSLEVENILNLPFSCFEYIKRDFAVVD